MSAPFQYSGTQFYERREAGRGVAFEEATGISLEMGCGVDCSIYRDNWQDVAPSVEIVCADYESAKPVRGPVPTLIDFAGQDERKPA